MKGQEICDVVKNYLKNKPYPYAIMINGEWGSGKSYFVKNELKKIIEEFEINNSDKNKYYHIINISLYGVCSVETISEQIATRMVFDRFGKAGQAGKTIVGAGIYIASALSEKYIGKDLFSEIDSENIIEKLKEIVDIENYVFVFDDLERCQMQISDILGYINNLVENSNANVLVIANEAEIASIDIEINKELKYLLSLNKEIDFPRSSSNSIFNKNETSDAGQSLSINDIQKRLNYLFGSNELYKRSKEKLIGLTINFEPDVDMIIPNIVAKYLVDVCDEQREVVSSAIISQMRTQEYCNLRTVQGVLAFYKMIEFNRYKEHIHHEMIRYIINQAMKTAILVATGKNPLEHKKELNIYTIEPVHENIDKIIEQYFSTGMFPLDDVKIAIRTLSTELTYQIDKGKDPINKLRDFYILSEEEVISLYNDFAKRIEEDQYESDLYPIILGILCDLEKIQIIDNSQFLDGINSMKKNIENGIVLELYDGLIRANVSEVAEKYKEYYKELYQIKKKEISHKNEVSKIMVLGNGWGQKLDKYVTAFLPNQLTDLLCIVDFDVLIETLYQSSSNDIGDFRSLLFRCEHTEKEMESIDNLIEKIEPHKALDKVSKLQLNWLKLNLEGFKQGIK